MPRESPTPPFFISFFYQHESSLSYLHISFQARNPKSKEAQRETERKFQKMLRILRKTAPSMANSSGSGEDDLSTWEFVNASISDDEDIYSFDGDDGISEGDDATEEEPESKPVQGEDEDAGEPRDLGSPDVIMSIQSLSVSPPMTFPVEMTSNHVFHEGRDGSDDDDDGSDDDVRDVYHDDVDDELVPWKLKDRFGKQRIRKMGKRGGPKPNKSKRLPYYHNRPGCLYGKHGFGVQHSFI